MSRIGRKPITVPAGVKVELADNNMVTVEGPKGKLTQALHPEMVIAKEGDQLTVSRPSDSKRHASLHGLTRTLLSNMVEGVSKDFSKELEIIGVGYRAALQGSQLVMNLGYSHQVVVDEVSGIKFEVPAPNKIIVSGPDKQAVGQCAAEIRSKRPPGSYNAGKGIRYSGEYVRILPGKAGKGKK